VIEVDDEQKIDNWGEVGKDKEKRTEEKNMGRIVKVKEYGKERKGNRMG